MSDPGDSSYFPTEYSPSVATADMFRQPPAASSDPTVPLLNLSAVRSRMDSLQQFLSDSVNGNTILAEDQMATVSSELVSAIHQVIVNGAALLASSQIPNLPAHVFPSENLSLFSTNFSDANIVADEIAVHPKMEANYGDLEGESEIDEYEVVELDAVELLAEHMHFCDICGKGFKRDANLRMHMRAHGDQFKTAEALAKPENFPEQPQMSRRTRFSCPFVGCNRNKQHKKFRPLKSVICVKNHFKRSHCPKMYSCNRCNKKKFSVLADLKSHMKHCGESKWRCSCGTSFSRKDKLFGHMALFEGHRPAIVDDDDKSKGAAASEEDGNQPLPKEVAQPEAVLDCSGLDNGFFDGLLDGFGSIENFCLQEMLEASPDLNSGMEGLYNF